MVLFPPALVRQVAYARDYREVDTVSHTDRKHLLRFYHSNKRGCGGTTNESGPVKICVYFTTGKVSTSLEHPKAGKGQLQRSVGDITMLARVFDNPRVHSNTGYHKTEERKKKHKENRLNPRQLIPLACDKYKCSLVPGPPQNKNKLVVFKHPTDIRIRVWLNTATVGIMHQEVYVKNVSMRSLETYLENPLSSLETDKSVTTVTTVTPPDLSHSTYRPPLSNIQATTTTTTTTTATSAVTNLTDSRLITCVERNILVSLAAENGFSKTKDQPTMVQFNSKTIKAAPVVNVYPTKGTVMLQGRGGTETKKGCSVSDFLKLLGQVNSSVEHDSDINRDSNAQDATENETALVKAVRKTRENAAQLYH